MRLSRRLTFALAVIGLAHVLSACEPRVIESNGAGGVCTRCHGGLADQSGAPPNDVRGHTDPSLPSVGAHTSHVRAGIDCSACHVKPSPGDHSHIDGTVRVTWGPVATANGALSPRYDEATHTCAASYCHSFYASSNQPDWTAPRADSCGTCHGLPPAAPHPDVGSDLAICSVCHSDSITAGGQLIPAPAGQHLDGSVSASGGHVAGWMDTGSAGFHAFSVARGLGSCRGCHGQDLGGGISGVGCASCHGETWQTNCVMCHGGELDTTGAPPKTIWGYEGDPVRVGAHAAHVNGGALTNAIGCATCHVVPADVLSDGHIDVVTGSAQPTASMTFSGTAAEGGATTSWDRVSRGCSVYCHGSVFDAATRGSDTTPDWTGGSGEATCGSCHASPPGGLHPSSTECGACHTGYGSAAVNLDTHVNGQVEFSMNCTACHGVPPGGTHPASSLCGACHVGYTAASVNAATHMNGQPDFALNCTACHGVPPGGTHPASSQCGDCHLGYTSASVNSATHVNGQLDVSCTGCHGAPPGGTHPASPQCGSCHVGYGEASVNAVTHMNGQVEVNCASCHGVPPAGPHPASSLCGACHPGYTAASVDSATHLNGQHEVQMNCTACHGVPPGGTHPASSECGGCHVGYTSTSVSSTTHVNGQVEVSCTLCHGAPPGGTHPAISECGGCHVGYTSTSLNPETHQNGRVDYTCAGCHGDVTRTSALPTCSASGAVVCVDANLAVAPPITASGRPAGAHLAHVNPSTVRTVPLRCEECHAGMPPPTHLDGTADVQLGARAGSAASYDPAVGCSATWCHGNYSGVYSYIVWPEGQEEPTTYDVPYSGSHATPRWTDGPMTCGSCHGNPPPGYWHSPFHGNLGQHRECQTCHADAISVNRVGTITDPALHVNGTVDVTPRWGSGCGCHGF